jgi:catechol 2,3-dioxygenase-like lactoylglutathione lyase family enzyme
MSMSAIAARRGTSRYSVRYHLRNAAQKIGVGTTELRHFPGVSSASARSHDKQGTAMKTDSQLSLGPLGQVSMLIRSVAKTHAWYSEVLGLPHVFTFGDLVFFDCGGTRLFMREVSDAEWRPSSILYFLVPDIVQAHAELTRRAVTFLGAPHMIFRDDSTGTEEWMAFFNDPDANTLAIMARVAGAT